LVSTATTTLYDKSLHVKTMKNYRKNGNVLLAFGIKF